MTRRKQDIYDEQLARLTAEVALSRADFALLNPLVSAEEEQRLNEADAAEEALIAQYEARAAQAEVVSAQADAERRTLVEQARAEQEALGLLG